MKCNSHVDVHGCGLHHSLYLEARRLPFRRRGAVPWRGLVRAAACFQVPALQEGCNLGLAGETWSPWSRSHSPNTQLNPHPLPKVPRRSTVLFSVYFCLLWFRGVRPLRKCALSANAQMSRR